MNNNILLPDDNFAETSNDKSIKTKSKKSPQNPVIYFWIVSLVAFLIKDLVAALPSTLYSWVIMFMSFSSSLTGNSMEFIEQGPLWNFFENAFSSFTIIMFGILFVKYITSKTVFNGNIKKYRFIYYTWPFAVGGFVLDIIGLVSSLVLLKVQNDYASVSGSVITLALGSIVSIVSFIIRIFAAYLCARMLNAAALGDETSQLKELRLLAIGVTISTIISLIVFVIRNFLLSDFSVFTTIVTVLSKVITVVAIWIAVTVKPKDIKCEKLIFTIIPIVVICDSIVYTIIESFVI